MSGPIPAKSKRRRNAPTIPTTELPVGGRKGRAPAVPEGIVLGQAGRRWWKWAWSTPQAAAWDLGSYVTIAQRAQLEDDLAALENFDIGEIPMDDEERAGWLKSVESLVRRLQRMAVGHISILREMRERDDRLGLSTKAAAQLRMTFQVEQPAPDTSGEDDEVSQRRAERQRRLKSADG